MKQNITLEQLNELPNRAKCKLSVWYYTRELDPKEVCLGNPLLTIGQMFEFLIENGTRYFESMSRNEAKNLCDIRWEEVKQVMKIMKYYN